MRRQGFTLVELLVAVALIVLIMAILSQAFVEGLESFRQLKAVGDLQEELRTAAVRLRSDLLAQHFTTGKLSTITGKPADGFFRIQQPLFQDPRTPNPTLVSSYPEGLDSNFLWSYTGQTMPTPANPTPQNSPILHFSIMIPSANQRPTDFYTVLAPNPATQATQGFQSNQLAQQGPLDYRQAGTMLSQWAEVCWFLAPLKDPATGQQLTATVPNVGATAPTPLWALYRRQRLLVTDQTLYNQINQQKRVPVDPEYPFLSEVCCKPDIGANAGLLYFPQPNELSRPGATPLTPAGYRRAFSTTVPGGTLSTPFPMGTGTEAQPATATALLNSDLVLADVISFEVKVLCAGRYSFEDFVDAERAYGLNPAGTTTAYDTASTPTGKNPTNNIQIYQIKAIQITLRIWDSKTEQTRQVTIIQDM